MDLVGTTREPARPVRLLPQMFSRPPRWLFHLALVPGALLILWAASLPGFGYSGFMLGLVLTFIGALIWLAWLTIGFFIRRKHHIPTSHRAWFLVAPVAGAIVFALLATGAPLLMRWQLAKDDFEHALRSAPPPNARTEWVDFDVPARVGSYQILEAARVGDGVIFWEANGALFDDAGFAHLPSGPFAELENGSFESPEFRPLGGGWYAWTASW